MSAALVTLAILVAGTNADGSWSFLGERFEKGKEKRVRPDVAGLVVEKVTRKHGKDAVKIVSGTPTRWVPPKRPGKEWDEAVRLPGGRPDGEKPNLPAPLSEAMCKALAGKDGKAEAAKVPVPQIPEAALWAALSGLTDVAEILRDRFVDSVSEKA